MSTQNYPLFLFHHSYASNKDIFRLQKPSSAVSIKMLSNIFIFHVLLLINRYLAGTLRAFRVNCVNRNQSYRFFVDVAGVFNMLVCLLHRPELFSRLTFRYLGKLVSNMTSILRAFHFRHSKCGCEYTSSREL